LKGIILAGGIGSRLYPITKGVSKQLLPVYDKPMIYYPLSVLMIAGIKEVLIISTPQDLPRFKKLFNKGSDIGVNFEYVEQPSPDGLAQAFILGEDFIGDDHVCLILGDNIFYGHGLSDLLSNAIANNKNKNLATIFGYHVDYPERYGVVDFDKTGRINNIEEKPENPKSNYAVTGLYFYPNDVIKKAKKILPSSRGELEITTLNQMYLREKRLNIELMGRGYAWLDTGTHKSLLEASSFIEIIERRQGLKVACIEEIAYQKGFITKDQLIELCKSYSDSDYKQYLIRCIKGDF
jgi:glucose-1-phosphate thymidylyltransferase